MRNRRIRSHESRSTGRLFLFALFILLFQSATPTASAQPNLNFKRVTVNWPTIELYFSVGCNGKPAYNMARQDFRVLEDGRDVGNFTLWCPDPTVRCAISVSLVFDASGSMAGSGNAGAKAAGQAFIDQMDGNLDEAAVLWFTTNVVIAQQMTTLKPLLYSAVQSLPASGGSSVWDGAYAGIVELINNGVNQCRAVILMTDGGDSGSTRTPSEIISLANRERIRVFTIGLGSSINASELEMIALLTGGRYYQTPNAGQLAAIYQDITTIIFQGFQQCVITYEADCPDGSIRSIELQLQNFCGGTDVKTKTYRAPVDTTGFSRLQMEFGDRTGLANTGYSVPLNLLTALNNKVFPQLSFTILTDSSCGSFQNVTIPPGSLLDKPGIQTAVTPVAGGYRIETVGVTTVSGSGLLMSLNFIAPDVQDTTCCTLQAQDVALDRGCYLPEMDAGQVCIVPAGPMPLITCQLETPQELTWHPDAQWFSPNPFDVTMHITNSGLATAQNTRFRISYDTTIVTRVAPQSDTQPGNPVDLPAGQSSQATWQFVAKKTGDNREAAFSVEAVFDNHDTVICQQSVPFGPVLECTVDVPVIMYDTAAGVYDPMPFPVSLQVRNTGGASAANLRATLQIDSAFTLVPGVLRTQILTPSSLVPGGAPATALWRLEHQLTAVEQRSTVTVLVSSPDHDTLRCEQEIVIPAIPGIFDFQLSASGPLQICQGQLITLDAGSGYLNYDWNTGEHTRKIVVGLSGTYFCTVTDSLGRHGVSDTLRVTITMAKPPTIAVSQGSLLRCEGDTTVLLAEDGYLSYSWNTGGMNRSLTVTKPGFYMVTVVDSNGCTARSDTITVANYPSPKPVVQRQGDMLLADTASAWQWYREGQPIPGATGQFLQLQTTGTYTVEVTDIHGCTGMSDPFTVNTLDVRDLPPSVQSFEVYPNPARNRFTLLLVLRHPSAVTVTVTDLLGRTMLQKMYAETETLRETLPLSGFTPGCFLLRIQTRQGGVLTKMLLVE